MKIGDNVVLRGTIKGVTYGEYGFPHYLVTLPNGCETEFPKPYIENLQRLDKPEKVKVPQFVADVIEGAREQSVELEDAFEYVWEVATGELREWFRKLENRNNFARAWLDGYEVEKEKKYFVKLKAVDQYLVSVKDEDFLGFLQSRLRSKFTRKELEDANLGWVFDCPGVEIEEVDLCH